MSLNSSTSEAPHLVSRARGLLFSPCAEWERIAAEPTTVARLFIRFVLPLAAIGPLAVMFNGLVFSHRRLGATVHWSALSILLGALIAYAMSLLMTCVLALIIDALAPGFCGCKNRVQAFKVAAYAGAAGWLAGVFGALPWLGPLVLVGTGYSVYLLYLGLPRLMGAPRERALAYTAMTVGAGLTFGVLAFVALGSVAAVVSSVEGVGGASMTPGRAWTDAPSNPAHLDLAQLAVAAKQAELAARDAQAHRGGSSGRITPVDAAALKALLPGALPPLARTSLSGERRAAAGYSATTATAIYRAGAARLSLRVTDLAAASALAGEARDLLGARSRTSDDGKASVGIVDGRLTAQQFDRRGDRGRYAVLVDDRFLIEADGVHVTLDQLKAAALAPNPVALLALAKRG